MESIFYARLPDDIVVVRIIGPGSFQNSPGLTEIVDIICTGDAWPQFVFDLGKCTTMDSTFMGTLASMAMGQKKGRGTAPLTVNTSAHVKQQLDLIGLKFILDIREADDTTPGDLGNSSTEFAGVPPADMSKLERTVMMIEAHERLLDVDEANEIKFKNVIDSLKQSLERTRNQE